MNEQSTTGKSVENRQEVGRDANGRFTLGNPSQGGCPKGTKQRATKIRDTFFQVFFDEFGDLDDKATLKRLRSFAQMHETDFLRILAGLLPKDLNIEGEAVTNRTTIIRLGEPKSSSSIEILAGDTPRAMEHNPSI